MKHLFIIGNGFDCYKHKLPTKYADFRKYILLRYPDAENYDELIPESTLMPNGDEKMDMEDVAGYITRVIDSCGGDEWKDLEYYLGAALFDALHYDLDKVPWDGSDKETMRAVYNNENLSSNMRQTFVRIKSLFCDWVQEKLANLDLNGVKKDTVADVLKNGDGFLNFNYTRTLEEVYGINSNLICHIHGQVGDSPERICFGHGDDESVPEWADSLGADSNLTELKRELQKDTRRALKLHEHFFENMNEIETIHSFGFGFADVDMYYIEEISKRIDLSKAIWYLNKHDNKGTEKRRKLERMGFCVDVDYRW